MTDARLSPSGPGLTIELETDAVVNESIVPGVNVSDALDFLFTADNFNLFDEFLGGTLTTLVASTDGGIGELGWSFVTTGGQLLRPVTGDFIGAYQCSANASQISGVRPGPNGGGASATFPISTVSFVYWNAVPNIASAVNGTSRFGFGALVEQTQFGTDGVFFEAAPGANWRVIGRRASVNTTIVTTIPWSPLVVVELAFSRDTVTGGFNAFIDGVPVGALTAAQIPTTRVNAMMQVQATAGGTQDAIFDTCRLNYDR